MKQTGEHPSTWADLPPVSAYRGEILIRIIKYNFNARLELGSHSEQKKHEDL